MASKQDIIIQQVKILMDSEGFFLPDPDVSVEGNEPRHKVGIDCLSLNEDDGEVISAEEQATSEQMYQQIIKSLDTDRERFIAIALDHGFENIDIANMLSLHPSQVTRGIQKIRQKLSGFITQEKE